MISPSLYTYSADVVYVVDGDTCDVVIDVGFNTFRKERIRLLGINTPESRTKNLVEKKLGLAAKSFLKSTFKSSNNKIILKTTLDKKGKYGRILGTLFTIPDMTNINDLLISSGHATPFMIN